MKCPKCGKEIKKNYCMYCGYILDKDIFINKNKKGEPTLLETYFGYDYDKIVRNKNFLPRLLLGPLYIGVKGFIWQGLGLFILDLFLFYCFYLFNVYFPLPGFGSILNFLLIIFNRVLWMSLDNIIYLKLLNIKLENIKRKNTNNYRELIDIEQRKHSDILDFFLIICIIFIVIISLYLIYMNK